MVVVDKPAPDFEGAAYVDGKVKKVRLSDFKGKWVLVCFYPGDFTYVCATEVAGMIKNYEKLRQFGGQGIAISADSVHSHKVWAETSPAITSALNEIGEKFPPFPMIADPTFEIGRKYGVVDEGEGVETRGRFIVDPDGIVRGYEVLNATVGRNLEETFRQLQAFKFVRDTGKVTPAGWKPGEEGIEPTIENAGKI
ncbi:MAG: peroxiredoxin [Candidatus Hadarchaeota archaeon]|nr:peroxiredoxin [Candidatus Hadarchaeota archaeon]